MIGYTDLHVHCVPRDGAMHFRGWRWLPAVWFAGQVGIRGRGQDAAAAYMERLAQWLRESSKVSRAVLLALDRSYDRHGTPTPHMDGFAVANEDVLAWCRERPESLLFGASVHPHRHDALDVLEQVAAEGAVLIKLIPNSHGFDPDEERHRPYFRKLAELGLPLLCHSGAELVLPSQRQIWGDLRRLRQALDEGVTVIAAHGGSSGLIFNRATLRRFENLLRTYPNFYGDTAALGLVNRMGALLWWREHPEWFDRLLFGTDYPVPMITATWRPFLRRADYARLRWTRNPFERLALLLEVLGICPPQDGFETLLKRLGRALGPAASEPSERCNYQNAEIIGN